MRKILLPFPVLAFLLAFAAAPSWASERLVLMLDWFPNVDHVPVYAALQSGMFEKRGIQLEIQSPSESSDPLKLAAAGHADVALSYQPQVIMAASTGIPLKALGRLVGHPLTTLLFIRGKGISLPRDLEGRKIGYTVPGMMDILLRAFASLNGVRSYVPVNVGFSIVQALAAGQVDAVMGPFKNYEPVAMEMEGLAPGFFEIEQHGIPAYDELVFVAGAEVFKKKEGLLRCFLDAVAEGMAFTGENPEKALELYFQAVPEAPREMETRAFRITLPFFGPDITLDPGRWKAFGQFAHEFGMTSSEVNMDELLAKW